MENNIILFCPAPKTAGTTLSHILREKYQPNFAVSLDTIEQDILKIKNITHKENIQLQLITGHLYCGIHKILPSFYNYIYIVSFRNPIDRIISYYAHIVKHPWLHQHVKKLLQISSLSFSDFIIKGHELEKKYPYCFIHNGQSRSLSFDNKTQDLIQYSNQQSNDLYQQAINKLENEISAFTIVEKFHESLSTIQLLLKWDEIPSYKNLNASKKGFSVLQKDRDLISELNQVDIKLYSYASELLSKKLNL